MKEKKKQTNYFSKHNVGTQLRVLYIVAIIIPIVLIGSIVYIFSYQKLTENYEHLTAMKARQIQSVLMTTTLYMENVYDKVTQDEELQELLASQYEDTYHVQHALMGYDGFTQILRNTASLTGLQLYVNEDFLKQEKEINYFTPITDSVKATDWYRQASATRGNFWKSSLRVGKYGVLYWELNYYCRIPIPKTSSYAILVLTVSNDHLRSLIQRDEYDVYISVNSDPVFFSSDRSYSGNSLPVDLSDVSVRLATGERTINSEHTIAATTALVPYNTDDQINILVTARDAMYYIHRLALVFILILCFTVAISALIIFLYARYFSARIQTLRLAMHKVSHNDYEIVHSMQGDDELTATFTDLTTMVTKLKETEAKIYEAKIKEQELHNQQQQMELKLLANQINPHFLYNTLETIRMKAFAEGNRDVATAIKLLGKSMRYVLNNTKTTATTLDKEIDYIRTYLSIQQIRFGSRLGYTIRIDDNLQLSNYQVLPLLIQPIVENAFSHGLRDAEYDGHIIIKISRSGNDTLITDVFDNGVGMDQKQLNHVIEHLDIPQLESDHGVGLYNINNRVHLFYGAEYGLAIKSRPGMGTLVTLTIPLINLREEEE